MTVEEFSNEFDIQYDNISTNSAPGLDLYEKSVYLTRAQLELIKDHFNPGGNKYKEGFEGSSKRRVDLEELVKTYNSQDKEINHYQSISDDSQFFTIPSDTFLIVQEQVVSYDNRLCGNNKLNPTNSNGLSQFEVKSASNPIWKDWYIMDVKPITHDDYNVQKKNPFKKPYEKVTWRINYNYSSYESTLKQIELICPYELNVYRIRYVEFPKPIILTNLTEGLLANEGLSIDGYTDEMTCRLNKEIHREIIDRAAELALVDYKPEQSLQYKTQMNLRNE